jgi:hypothetical protein
MSKKLKKIKKAVEVFDEELDDVEVEDDIEPENNDVEIEEPELPEDEEPEEVVAKVSPKKQAVAKKKEATKKKVEEKKNAAKEAVVKEKKAREKKPKPKGGLPFSRAEAVAKAVKAVKSGSVLHKQAILEKADGYFDPEHQSMSEASFQWPKVTDTLLVFGLITKNEKGELVKN